MDIEERLLKANEKFAEGMAAIGRAMEHKALNDNIDRWLFRTLVLGIMVLAGVNVAQAGP